MPLLQYKCPKCGREFDELVKSHADPAYCPACGTQGIRSYSGTIITSTGKPVKKCSGNCKTCGGCK